MKTSPLAVTIVPPLLLVPVFIVLVALDPPTMLLSIFGVYAASAPLLWVGRRMRRLFRGPPRLG